MKQFPGITTEYDSKNNIKIMVRFKYEGKIYPVKNFTKLYGCKTQNEANKKLQEIKILISKGQNPFIKSENNLDEIFKKKVEVKRLDKSWAETTISNYELFYALELKKTLGHKKLNKITYEDLKNIIESKDFIVKKSVWKNRLKQILNPIFKDSMKQGLIFVNPCDNIEHFKIEEPEKLSDKTIDDNILFLSQEIYKAISKYPCKTKSDKPEYECYLYLVLMTGRRIGELCQLTKEDCYLIHKKIISPKEITKTKKEFDFPIPDECIEYIKTIKTGLLFPNIERGSVYLMFQRLLKYTNIDLRKGKILTVHNTRDLLLNNLIENGVDSRLADFCLDHKIKGTINHYISFTFKQKKEAFEKYWSLVRNDEISVEKEAFRKEFFKYYELEFEKAWENRLNNIKTSTD